MEGGKCYEKVTIFNCYLRIASSGANRDREQLRNRKKDKSQFNSCHQQCRDQHSEGIKKCIDSGVKPLSNCIKEVNQDKKECLNGCRD